MANAIGGATTGKSIAILFRLLADGTQARKDLGATGQDFGREIRAAETLGQRLLSILSRPVRGRAGFFGSLGISAARQGLIVVAKNAIDADAALSGAAVKSGKLAAGLTAAGRASAAIKAAVRAQELQRLGLAWEFNTSQVIAFRKALEGAFGALADSKEGRAAQQKSQALLSRFGITGAANQNRTASQLLQQFSSEFNKIENEEERAAIAADLFGARVTTLLPRLEAVRVANAGLATSQIKTAEAITLETQAEERLAKAQTARIAVTEAENELTRLKRALILAEAEATEASAIATKKKSEADAVAAAAQAAKTGVTSGTVENTAQQAFADANAAQVEASNLAAVAKKKQLDVAAAERKATKLSIEAEKAEAIAVAADTVAIEANNRAKEIGIALGKKQGAPASHLFIADRDATRAATQAEIEARDAAVASEAAKAKALVANEAVLKKQVKAQAAATAATEASIIADKKFVEAQAVKEAATRAVAIASAESTLPLATQTIATEAQALADEKLAAVETLRVAVGEALNVVTARQTELNAAEAVSATAVGDSYVLSAAELKLFESALKKTTSGTIEGLLKEIARLVKQKDALSRLAGTGGSTPISQEAVGAMQKLTQDFFSLSSAESKAQLVTASVGEEVAGTLTPALEGATAALGGGATAAAVTGGGGGGSGLIGGFLALGGGATAASGGILAVVAAVLSVVAVGAVVEAILFKIAAATTKTDAIIGRLADRTGLTAETLSTLDLAAKRAELGGIKDLQERIGAFDRILGQAAQGSLPEVSRLLRGLGIDTKTAGKDINATFVQIVNAYNNLADPTQRAVILQRLFQDRTGRLGQTFRAIGPDFQKYQDQLKASNLLLSGPSAKAAREFEAQWKQLGQTFSAIGISFGRQLVPEFVRGLKILNAEANNDTGFIHLLGVVFERHLRAVNNSMVLFIAFARTIAELKPEDPNFLSTLQLNIQAIVDASKASVGALQDIEKEELVLEQAKRQREANEKARAIDATTRLQIQLDAEKNFQEKLEADFALHGGNQVKNLQAKIESMRRAAQEEAGKLRADAIDESKRILDEQSENETLRAAKIAELNAKADQVEQDFRNQEEKLWVDFRTHQKEQQDKIHADTLDRMKVQADAEVKVLEDEMAKNEKLTALNTVKIQAIRKAETAADIKELERRRDVAQKGTDERAQLERDLAAALLKQKAQDAQDQRDFDDAQFKVRMLDIQKRAQQEQAISLGEAGRIANIRDDVASRLREVSVVNPLDQQLLEKEGERKRTLEQAEREIFGIVDSGFRRRIALKQDEIEIAKKFNRDTTQLDAELKALEQERQNNTEDADKAIREGRLQDLADFRSYKNQFVQVQESLNQAQLTSTIGQLTHARELIRLQRTDSISLINDITELEHRREASVHGATIHELQTKKEDIKASNLLEKEKLIALRNVNAEIEAEMTRHTDEEIQIERDRVEKLKEAQRTDPSSARGFFGDRFADTLDKTGSKLAAFGALGVDIFGQLSDSAGNFQSITADAFSAVGQGLGDMLQQWALMGTVGPNAMRKLTASVLAGFAAQAVVKVLMEVGEGVSNIAKGIAASANPFTAWQAPIYFAAATANFHAAAIWGLLGGGAALAARGIAGNAFKQAGTGASTDKSATPQQISPLTLNRNQGQATTLKIQVTSKIETKVNDSKFGAAIENHVLDNIVTGGSIRDAVLMDKDPRKK